MTQQSDKTGDTTHLTETTAQTAYDKLSDAEWRKTKDEWLEGINSYSEPQLDGKRKRIKHTTQRYLTDVYLRMGNGRKCGKYDRGTYAFPALATASRMDLGGSEESMAKMISRARRDAISKGFLTEIRRGTGGNVYRNKGSIVAMSFEFRNRPKEVEQSKINERKVNEMSYEEFELASGMGDYSDEVDVQAAGTDSVDNTGTDSVDNTGTDSVDLNKVQGYIQGSSKETPTVDKSEWGSFGEMKPNPFDGVSVDQRQAS